MPRLRFILTLTEPSKERLADLYRSHPNFTCRQRAQAILLSYKGYTIQQLQDIFEVDRDTISHWLNRYEQSGSEGLQNLPRTGRPPIYTPDEIGQLKTLIDQEPRQIKQAQTALQDAAGKTSSTATIKRALIPTRIWTPPGGFVCLIAMIDIASRHILSWRISNSMDVVFCLELLEEALVIAVPSVINTD